MASRKENLKALFTNTRSRVIILFTVLLLVVAVIIGGLKIISATKSPIQAVASLSSSPQGIQSVPGALNPTAQYASLQETQNSQQAEKAIKSGGSAIPTIIRTQAFGQGVQAVGPVQGEGSVGFETLAREEAGGTQQGLWLQTLKDSQCSLLSVQKVVAQGAVMSDLRSACSCLKLKEDGYSLADLSSVCSCVDLREAGYNADQLKAQGFSAERLRLCGFSACNLKSAGFSVQAMKDGGYSDGELKGAGFPEDVIAKPSRLPDGVTAADVLNAGCEVKGLSTLRNEGVSAGSIRQISGCTVAQLKAAGFTPESLRKAGFSAATLKAAGFTAEQLRQAGYSPRSLLDAGFTPAQLASVGFTPEAIRRAEMELPPGFTLDNLKQTGCDVGALARERAAGVSALLIRQAAGCDAKALAAAGFLPNELAQAGLNRNALQEESILPDARIQAAGCDPAKLKTLFNAGGSAKRIHQLNGCTASILKAAGFNAPDLIDAGFTPQALVAEGFTPQQLNALSNPMTDAAIKAAGCDPLKLNALYQAGVAASRIHALNGCTASALKNAGFNAKSLLQAGFTPSALAQAGFTPDELRVAGELVRAGIRAAGCDPTRLASLRDKGVSATDIQQLNDCSATALKQAGYDPNALAKAGFTPQQLLAAGFSAPDVNTAEALETAAIKAAGCDPVKLSALQAQGVTASRIHDLNGCSAAILKKAGFDAKALQGAGFSLEQLKAAGFDAKQLADAGFTPQQLLSVGFTPQALLDAGLNPAAVIAAGRTANCSEASLRAAHAVRVTALTIQQTLGCGATALKQAGFNASELKKAGFSAAELKQAGFNALALKAAGFSAKALHDAGFSASDLKGLGFTANQLHDAGFSATDLKQAGFTDQQLKDAGFTAAALKDAGLSAAALRNVGFSANDLADAGFSPQLLQEPGIKLPQSAVPTSQSALGSVMTVIPSVNNQDTPDSATTSQASNAKQLQSILDHQQKEMAKQRYQQKIQQRTSNMLSAANQAIQSWKDVPIQVYIGGTAVEKAVSQDPVRGNQAPLGTQIEGTDELGMRASNSRTVIKTGDVLFAVLDTAINSDEPGPILATIVSGKLTGTKLIGSFNLGANAEKMVISFNTMSIPGVPRTVPISAFAIDPDTARTALASTSNHHYLSRYGSLFAATFLEGFGNAFQSANTTITIGGTGGMTNTTVQNGVGRSVLENAVIGLATLGKNWGQVAQQQFNRPTTVQVSSGTGIGILFTQDVATL